MKTFHDTIESSDHTIWRYSYWYPPVDENFRISLGEGGTELVSKNNDYFKREDQNPTGSVKDRGIAYQLSDALQSGGSPVVISSSGNAAISAATYARDTGIECTVFVSPRSAEGKREKLHELGALLRVSETPLKDSLFYAQENGFRHLRQSVDDTALWGYSSLGFELYEQLSEMNIKLADAALFFPVSSASTLVGVGRAFNQLISEGIIEKGPQLHAVQSMFLHPVVDSFIEAEEVFPQAEPGLASALVAPKTQRKDEAVELIRSSSGSGWVVAEDCIKEANEWLESQDILTSAEGALALAGSWAAADQHSFKTPIILLTGKKYNQ